MAIHVKETMHIADSFKEVIKGGKYEELILRMMNDSKIVFPNQYSRIEEQSDSQSDFLDICTGENYDAKLAIIESQGNLLGRTNSDYLSWAKSVYNLSSEFSKIVFSDINYEIEELTLYKIIVKQLLRSEFEEHLIFFFPYSVTYDCSESINVLFAGDVFYFIFKKIRQKGIIGEKKLFVIYPTNDNKICLRCLNDDRREYLSSFYLCDYISFTNELVADD